MLVKWLRQRTAREQMSLVAATFVVTLAAIWYLLLMPLHQSRLLSEQRVAQAVQSLADVQQMAHELTVLRDATDVMASSQNLSQFLDESARSQNIRISSLEPTADGSSVLIRVDGSNTRDLLRWIASIENSAQAALDSLTVSPGAGQDVTTTLRVRALQP